LNPGIPQKALEPALYRIRLTQKSQCRGYYAQSAPPGHTQAEAKGRQSAGLGLTQLWHVLRNFLEPLVNAPG
jgi:hypothetical protein